MLAKDTLRAPLEVRLLAAAFLLASHAAPVAAGPWVEPGDVALRHDLQLLADAGLLGTPLTSWPLSWPDIAASLKHPQDGAPLPRHLRAAFERTRARIARAADGSVKLGAEIAGNSDPQLMRGFANVPRSEGEVAISAEGGNAWAAYRLKVTAAHDPADGDEVHFDGSYGSLLLGNWTFSAAAVDRWWGPGWDGSLILSSNARPVPALVLQRHRSTPFRLAPLRWLGPWQFTTFMGQLESDRVVARPLLFGMRLNFRPAQGLEIGASRTAQWCGEGRPCNLDTFGNLLVGTDNVDEQLTKADEPGNQLGGFDFRWAIGPVAAYGQLIGEDESGGLPSRHIGLAGLETWGAWGGDGAAWRAFLEFADTTVGLFSDRTFYNTAYNHGIYQSGYRYRGRSLGHGADNDTRMLTLGLMLSEAQAGVWQLTARHADFNRDDGGLNTFSPRRTRYNSVSLRHERPLYVGRLAAEVGVHQTRVAADDERDVDASAALTWRGEW